MKRKAVRSVHRICKILGITHDTRLSVVSAMSGIARTGIMAAEAMRTEAIAFN